jgi:dihydroorotate dehydrogenase (NAD+) catalytic subunit
MPDISVNLAGIKLKTPVLAASGTFGYGDETADLVDLSKIGAIITKTITKQPRSGNPTPRIAETASGMLNAIGLENIGLREFINKKSQIYKKLRVPVIVSIAGEGSAEYATIAQQLSDKTWVAGIELNLSCPNLNKTIICKDDNLVTDIIRKVKEVFRKTVIAKLSPDVNNIGDLSLTAQEAGADALTLVNTFPGMAIDINTFRPKLANRTGGLSGLCIKPLALRCVYEVAKYPGIKVPIIGCGGVMTGDDAVEYLLAGASAVSVGTANFLNSSACINIAEGIQSFLKRKKIKSLGDIIGKVKV